jgi:hypothetical protein
VFDINQIGNLLQSLRMRRIHLVQQLFQSLIFGVIRFECFQR